MPALNEKQNITLRLSKQTIHKARVLAAHRSTSISGLLTSQIEQLAETEDDAGREAAGVLDGRTEAGEVVLGGDA